MTNENVIFLPAKPAHYVSMDEYIHLLQCVPEGRIVRRSDIDRYLCKKYRTDRVDIEMKPLFFNPLWEGIPYWREVSEKGYLWKNPKIAITSCALCSAPHPWCNELLSSS